MRCINNQEVNLQNSLLELASINVPLSVTYYVQSGVIITNHVMIKDVIFDCEELALVFANGSIIPISRVLNVQCPKPILVNNTTRTQLSEQEIYNFQLANLSLS